MKAVLLSIKPEWWTKILSGEKTLEIRKTAPLQFWDKVELQTIPFQVFVYVSGTGMVQGKFTCPGWYHIHHSWQEAAKLSCVPAPDLHRYAGPNEKIVAWQMKNPEAFTPLPLSSFGVKRAPMSWQYINV